MLKKIGVELIHNIERYLVDAKIKAIDIEIATGSLVDGEFVSDGRSLIKHSIVNIEDQPEIDMGDGVIIEAVAGRNWFDEAAMFIADSNEAYDGLTDYEYNSRRLWTILVEMGLMTGEVV